MKPEHLLRVLEDVAAGRTPPDAVVERLARWPAEAVSVDGEPAWARLDHHRPLRIGLPEVVLASGKTAEQTVELCRRLDAVAAGFLVTRADDGTRAALRTAFPDARVHDVARIVHKGTRTDGASNEPRVAVVSAGTSDLPVAEEAAITLEAFGHTAERIYDVGVAGLHRVLETTDRLRRAAAVIVVAGMEGALPSVVGGLVGSPVIAVPTSVGYGASFGGLAALLGMLNSCASGVTVVNIDNGFGAACAASRVLRALPAPAG